MPVKHFLRSDYLHILSSYSKKTPTSKVGDELRQLDYIPYN